MMPFFAATVGLLAAIAEVNFSPQPTAEFPASPRPIIGQTLPDASLFVAPPVPDDLGQPGRRADAGSRGCGSLAADAPTSAVTALVPQTAETETVFSLTAAPQPTLWLYVPLAGALSGTLAVQDEQGNLIYEGTFTTPEAGLVGLQWPETLASWEVGDRRRWFVVLGCEENEVSYSLSGWMARGAAPHLAARPPAEPIADYAAQGLWHDALTQAVESRSPAWATLLQEVSLDELATVPRLDCCALTAIAPTTNSPTRQTPTSTEAP